MESEKVKEIKKALEDCASNEFANKLPYIDGHKCKAVAFADILTLINELENENKELKRYKMDWLNSEKMHLQADMEDKAQEVSKEMLDKYLEGELK